MRREVVEHALGCPFCGESVSVLVDTSEPEQRYVEDCQVCCRPMALEIQVDVDGSVVVTASTDSN